MPDYEGYLMAFKDGYEKGQLAMRERAAKEACPRCQRGQPLIQAYGDLWLHGRMECGGGAIRALEPEEPK